MASAAQSVSLAVVGDHRWLRAATLYAALEAGHGRPAAHFPNLDETTVDQLSRQRPDAVVVLPSLAGATDAIGRLAQSLPENVGILVLDGGTAETRALIRLGCSVISIADSEFRSEQLVAAAGAMNQGLQVTSPGIARVLALGEDDPVATFTRRFELSSRQTQVLLLLAGGSSNKDIATALDLSIQTVKNLLVDAYRKIGAFNRVMAARIVLDNVPAAAATRRRGPAR